MTCVSLAVFSLWNFLCIKKELAKESDQNPVYVNFFQVDSGGDTSAKYYKIETNLFQKNIYQGRLSHP